ARRVGTGPPRHMRALTAAHAGVRVPTSRPTPVHAPVLRVPCEQARAGTGLTSPSTRQPCSSWLLLAPPGSSWLLRWLPPVEVDVRGGRGKQPVRAPTAVELGRQRGGRPGPVRPVWRGKLRGKDGVEPVQDGAQTTGHLAQQPLALGPGESLL